MDIHGKPIGERIDWLFAHAQRHSENFCTPEATLARQRYLARHPTAIAVMKCMDGRINIPVATRTPVGIIQPFRNLGGIFDLGWPHLGEVLAHYVHRRIGEGRRVLLLATYHFSRGSPERGCAGFAYDRDAAIAHVRGLLAQTEAVFGHGYGTVYPLICGFETDEDALILHGSQGGDGPSRVSVNSSGGAAASGGRGRSDGATLDLSTLTPADAASLPERLAALFPDMPQQMQSDLLPLLAGNLEHIAELRRSARALDTEHREWMICLGRGFDFLHMPNLALIVGPYSPQLAEPIRMAAGIIADNMESRRIPNDGFLLLASAPYDDVGSDRARAELKSRFLAGFAAGVIGETHPQLAAGMTVRAAVLDWRSRRLERIDLR